MKATLFFQVAACFGVQVSAALGKKFAKDDSSVQFPCNFGSTSIPCYSLHESNNLVYEVDLNIAIPYNDTSSRIGFHGSTHEMATDPLGNFWVSHQASDQLTRIGGLSFKNLTAEAAQQVNKKATQSARTIGTDDIKDFLSFDLYLEGEAEATDPDSSDSDSVSFGVHQLLFPKHSQKNTSYGYMTLEFFDDMGGIGIWDWNPKLEGHRVPLKKIIPVPLKDEKTGWTCIDRSISPQKRAELGQDCPHGTHPHTIAEDGDGNLWVTLKDVGAIARLRNPDFITNITDAASNWRIYDLSNNGAILDPGSGSGPLPFYIQTDGQDSVWFNSITTGHIGVIKNATAEIPLAPVLFQVHLKQGSVEDSGEEMDGKAVAASRPGAFQVIPETGHVLLTLYNKYGSIVVARAPETDELEALIEEKQGDDAVTALILSGAQSRKYIKAIRITKDDAFLHLDYGVQDNGLLTLWLAASSNDFTGVDIHEGSQKANPFQIADQADTLIKVTDFDLAKSGSRRMSHKFKQQTIVAPTQASWIHRVLVLPSSETGKRDGSHVIATELYTDRLLVVEQTDLITKT